MLDIDNRVDEKVDIPKLELIAKTLSDKDIELILTDDEDIRAINSEFRGRDKPTDVLSFPLDSVVGFEPLGSIVISITTAKRVALEFKHSLDDEISLLFIHGMLHLLGFDHEKDSGDMRDKEKSLIVEFNLPCSLIIREESRG